MSRKLRQTINRRIEAKDKIPAAPMPLFVCVILTIRLSLDTIIVSNSPTLHLLQKPVTIPSNVQSIIIKTIIFQHGEFLQLFPFEM